LLSPEGVDLSSVLVFASIVLLSRFWSWGVGIMSIVVLFGIMTRERKCGCGVFLVLYPIVGRIGFDYWMGSGVVIGDSGSGSVCCLSASCLFCIISLMKCEEREK
jgi:hypothetical protein